MKFGLRGGPSDFLLRKGGRLMKGRKVPKKRLQKEDERRQHDKERGEEKSGEGKGRQWRTRRKIGGKRTPQTCRGEGETGRKED